MRGLGRLAPRVALLRQLQQSKLTLVLCFFVTNCRCQKSSSQVRLCLACALLCFAAARCLS